MKEILYLSCACFLMALACLIIAFTKDPKDFLPLAVTSYHGISINGKAPVSIDVTPMEAKP